jgi:hypothetical protein
MGQAQNWGLTTVKRLTWHAGAKDQPATLTVTPVSSTAAPGSPPEVATARSFAIPATLVVDEGLTPGPVVNKDEVRAAFSKLIPDATKIPAAMIDASTRAMIASELVVVSHAQGLTLKQGKTISADIDMPNPIGGPPMRAVETARLDSFDKKAGRAVVQWRQVLDPAAFKASTMGMLLAMTKNKLSPEKIEEARAAFADAAMQNETVCHHEIDLPTGLAVKVECNLTSLTTVQGKTQRVTEHWAVAQTLPEQL